MIPRRAFLRNGSVALASLGFSPSFLGRTAAAGTNRRKRLVAVFQRGGADGLNMVVPFRERAYHAARPSIAIAEPGRPDGAIDLDGFFGFHPRLAPLVPLWKHGALAVVHATGSPDGTRSHLDAQDYLETGTPGVKTTDDGWLNRVLRARRAARETPFRGIALSSALPRSLQGPAPALAIGQVGQVDVSRIGHGSTPANGAEYPRSPFGEALRQIAVLAKADVGLEIAFAETARWDHHVDEGGGTGQLAARLDDFARGLAALARDLGELLADTVILTMSEFGRALAENDARGTDHGHGTALFVIGGGVRGGTVYGRWPGLAPEALFEGRDLAVTTDFRDVFAEVVTKHLGVADASAIFPGYPVRRERWPGML